MGLLLMLGVINYPACGDKMAARQLILERICSAPLKLLQGCSWRRHGTSHLTFNVDVPVHAQ